MFYHTENKTPLNFFNRKQTGLNKNAKGLFITLHCSLTLASRKILTSSQLYYRNFSLFLSESWLAASWSCQGSPSSQISLLSSRFPSFVLSSSPTPPPSCTLWNLLCFTKSLLPWKKQSPLLLHGPISPKSLSSWRRKTQSIMNECTHWTELVSLWHKDSKDRIPVPQQHLFFKHLSVGLWQTCPFIAM